MHQKLAYAVLRKWRKKYPIAYLLQFQHQYHPNQAQVLFILT